MEAQDRDLTIQAGKGPSGVVVRRVPLLCKVSATAGACAVALGLSAFVGLGELVAIPMLILGFIALTLGLLSVVEILTGRGRYRGWVWVLLSLISGALTYIGPMVLHFRDRR